MNIVSRVSMMCFVVFPALAGCLLQSSSPADPPLSGFFLGQDIWARIEANGGGVSYVRWGPAQEIQDGFGKAAVTIPVQYGLGPPGPDEALGAQAAWWDPERMNFVRLGSQGEWMYPYGCELVLAMPGLLVPFLASVHLTLISRDPQDARVWECGSFKGEVAVGPAGADREALLTASSPELGRISIASSASTAPDSAPHFELREWTLPWAPSEAPSVPFTWSISRFEANTSFPRLELQHGSGQIPYVDREPWVTYTTRVESTFDGPPKNDSLVGSFPLSAALTATADSPLVEQFLRANEDVFVLDAIRRRQVGSAGETKTTWTIRLTRICEAEDSNSSKVLRLQVTETVLPMSNAVLPPTVEARDEEGCGGLESPTSLSTLASIEALPDSLVTFDEIVMRRPEIFPESAEANLLWFSTSFSCIPSSGWRVQLGVQPEAEGPFAWFSLVNGQMLYESLGGPLGQMYECPPYAPSVL